MRYYCIALACNGLLIAGMAILTGCSEKKDNPNDTKLAEAKKKSVDNLVDIGLAFFNYFTVEGGLPPPGRAKEKTDTDPRAAQLSWRVAIASYLDKGPITFVDPRLPIPDEYRDNEPEAYKVPYGTAKPTETSYRVFVGNGAAFDRRSGVGFHQFFDGLDNTILVVEAAEPVVWTSLDDFEYDPKKPLPKLGVFPGGFHALMADYTVRWIPDTVDEATLRAMITRNGLEKLPPAGEIVGKPSFDLPLPK